jgi:hypothetical protein
MLIDISRQIPHADKGTVGINNFLIGYYGCLLMKYQSGFPQTNQGTAGINPEHP